MNAKNNSDVPLGLGMALMQNQAAFARFSAMSATEQQKVIEHTHAINSKQEMKNYVNQIGLEG